jgi:hypothetical protein
MGPDGAAVNMPESQSVESSRVLPDGSIEVNTTVDMQAGKKYTMVLAVMSSNALKQQTKHGDGGSAASGVGSGVISAAEQMLDHACAESWSSTVELHNQWWDIFWNASSIDLGPERRTLESFWYGMQYMSGSMNRAGKQATGLWGPWIQSDDMNWNGDYTLDYSTCSVISTQTCPLSNV